MNVSNVSVKLSDMSIGELQKFLMSLPASELMKSHVYVAGKVYDAFSAIKYCCRKASAGKDTKISCSIIVITVE